MPTLDIESMHWDEWFSHLSFWHSCVEFQNDSSKLLLVTIDKYHSPSDSNHHEDNEALSHSFTVSPGQIHFHEFTDNYVLVTISYVGNLKKGNDKQLCQTLMERGGRYMHITDSKIKHNNDSTRRQ